MLLLRGCAELQQELASLSETRKKEEVEARIGQLFLVVNQLRGQLTDATLFLPAYEHKSFQQVRRSRCSVCEWDGVREGAGRAVLVMAAG